MTTPLQDLVRSFQQQLQPRIGTALMKGIEATIGRPTDNAIYADDTNRAAEVEVYVHLVTSDDPTSFAVALRGSFTRKDIYLGRPVLLTINDAGDYVIERADEARDAIFSAGMDELDDQSPVYLRQLVEIGTLHPIASSLKIRMAPGMFGSSYYSGSDTPDFSSGTVQDTLGANITLPTTNGQAKGILVQLDATTGISSYKQSAEFSAILSLAQAYNAGLLPAKDGSRYRLGYAKLVTGLVEFTYDHLWEVPELISEGELGMTSYENPLTANFTLPAGRETITHGVQTEASGVIRTILGIWWDL